MSFFHQVGILQIIGAIFMGIVAVIYSSAGFGGGSSYISIMALINLPYQTYPTLALICNLIVVTASSMRFIKNKMIDWKNILSWIIISIPMAFIGGKIRLPEKYFIGLLALLLLFAGTRILLNNHRSSSNYVPTYFQRSLIGGFLGLISGIVGIGGGIFLSPIMTYWKMDKAKNIAITTTLFIFVNSLSALIGKFHNTEKFHEALIYWPILLIVFIGGQIGNRWCVYKASDKELTTVAGALSILASCTLFYKIL